MKNMVLPKIKLFAIIMFSLIQLVEAGKNRRLPRSLKGGGGGGGGASSAVVDPNNYVVPEGFEFYVEPIWPPANVNHLLFGLTFGIEVIAYLIIISLVAHLYGKHQDRKLNVLEVIEHKVHLKTVISGKFKPLLRSTSIYD